MAKQNSRLLLVKIGVGTGPVVYSNLCGLNTRSFVYSSEMVDVTSIDCADPGASPARESIAGIRDLKISGTGFFENKAQMQLLVAAKESGENIVPLEITVPLLGVFTADFQVGDISLSGDLTGAITMDLSFEATGAISFVAEA